MCVCVSVVLNMVFLIELAGNAQFKVRFPFKVCVCVCVSCIPLVGENFPQDIHLNAFSNKAVAACLAY